MDAQMIAEVVRVDRFGNLVTNVDRRTFDRFTSAERIEIVAGTATCREGRHDICRR